MNKEWEYCWNKLKKHLCERDKVFLVNVLNKEKEIKKLIILLKKELNWNV